MAWRERGLSSNIIAACRGSERRLARSCRRRLLAAQDPQQLRQRIEDVVHHALLERDDGIVGDRDPLRADLGAALGDVAKTDSLLPEVAGARSEERRVGKECRSRWS